MKRLGVFLPRWNHLKTLLPIMEAAYARGIQVEVVCAESAGKPTLSAAEHRHAFAEKWPWAHWGVAFGYGYDAVIAHGVVHDAQMIRESGVPWVAVDHLHENAWWYLTGHPEFWQPWHRVCLSGEERNFLPDRPYTWVATQTGYTAFDGAAEDPNAIRAEYGLPHRYLLVGTAVRASTIHRRLWHAYFAPNWWSPIARYPDGYRGPSYPQILQALRDYADGAGMKLVGKGRWKHEDHPAHGLFDQYFTDEPTDPHRAWRLMQGATAYAGGISGLAVEALAAQVPTYNWAYYPPLLADHDGFKALRQALWIDGIWQAPGLGKLFPVYEREGWRRMTGFLETVGMHGHYFPDESTQALQALVIGATDGSASAKVLEACGL